MSNVLDDNVVILRFDNSDFEKNTKQSMATLDKLKNSVNKTGGESISGLEKTANNINLSGLGKAVDTVNKRFSLFGVAGMATLNRLTNSAITATSKIVTAIPKQAIQGGWQRALNIEQAKNLIEGLGNVWDETSDKYEEGMKTVKTAVDNAVTGTRYALDEAAIVASQLLSSGVKDTEALEESLKSISGLASVLNADYGDIGRIFAQVAGQGRMMGDDLLQLQQRGIGAAEEIAHYLTENKEVAKSALDSAIAQGKQVKKMQEIRDHAEITGADVREMVSAGAINFDILSNSFRGLFEQAEKANDTYTGSLANLKSAVNRIGESFMKIKLENMTYLFNALIPIVKRFKVLLDPLAEKVATTANAFSKFVINGIINPFGQAIGAEKLFDKLGWAAKDVGDKVTKANEDSAKSSSKSKKEILALNKEYQAARDIWYKGAYGSGSKRKNALEQIGVSYKATQAIVNQFYKDGFKWDKIEKQLIKDYNEKADAAEDSGKKISDSNEQQTKQYPTMIALLKGFVNILTSAKLVLQGVGNILKTIGMAIKKAITPGLKAGTNGFASFTEKILNAAKRFNEFSKTITNAKKRTAWLKDHKWVSAFVNAISSGFALAKNVITDFVGAIKEFFSQFTQSEGFDALKEQIKDLLGVLKDLGGGVLEKVTGQLGKLSNVGSGSNMTKIVNFFSGIAKGLADMIASIRRGENPLKGFVGVFGKVKEALSFKSLSSHGISAGINALSSKNGTVGMIVNATESVKKAHVPETFNKASKSIFNFFDGLSEKVKKVDFKGKFNRIFEAFKNADWDQISKIAFRVGSLAAIFKSIRDMGRLVDAAVGTLGSISGMFKSISNVANVYASQVKVQNFQTLAISVAILIGAITALAAVPTERLKPAIMGVVVILGLLAGIMATMSSKKFNPQAMTQVGVAFAAMGASLLLVAMACKVLAGIDGDGLFKAGVSIMAFMGMFILVAKMKSQVLLSGTVFLAMAAAINILVIALAALAIMPWAAILKGATAIAILMTELSLAARLAGHGNVTGLVAMALALDLLIPAIIIFAMMPFEQSLKGATIACTIIAMIGLASRTAGKSAGNMMSLVTMATMVGTLAAALVVLSMIDQSRLMGAAVALTATMMSFAVAADLAKTAKAGIALMSLAIATVAAAIIALVKIDAEAAIGVANSLTLLAAGLAVAFSLFGNLGVKGNLIGAGGLTLAIGVVTGIIAALGKLYESETAKKLIANGKHMAELLGDAIGSFFGSIASGFGTAATSGLGQMADNISAFAEKIQPFLSMVKGIDTSSVKGAKALADAIFQLTKADLVESLSVFAGMEDLAARMKTLGDGFVAFSNAVESIPEDTIDKANTAAKVVKTLATAFGEIPKTGGIASAFTGEVDVEGFIGDILKVAKALGDNGLGKAGLNELDIPDDLLGKNGKITKIAEVIGTMAAATKKIPKTGGLQQKLTGENDVSGMAEGILNFAMALGSNQEGMNSLATIEIPDGLTAEDGKITKICDIIAVMSTAAAKIPESGGLKQGILGNTTINEFASQLANAIPGLSKFITAIGSEELNFGDDIKNKILRVAEAVGAMGEASTKIPESGISLKSIVVGGQDISNFANQLSEAIPGLQDFASGLSGVDFGKGVFGDKGKLSKVVEAITAMSSVANALPKSKGWAQKLLGEKDLGNFGKQLRKLMESLGQVGDVSINTDSISNAASAINAITPAIQAFKGVQPIPTGKNLISLGQSVVSFTESMGSASTKGLAGKASAVTSAVKKLGNAASAGAKSLGSTQGFSSAGSSLGSDFVKGLNKSKSAAKSAGTALAKQAKSGAGSVSLYSGGTNVGQGFVNGILAKKSAAYKAGYALGKASKKGQRDATGESSPAKEFIKGGKYAGEGFVIGMKSYERKVYKQGESIGLMSIAGTNSGVEESINGLMDPVITPVVDLSDFNRGLDTMDNAFSRNRALGINSTFESSDYKTTQMMNNMVDTLNKMTDSKQPTNSYFTFNVDGAENPEQFAKRFVRQVQLEMRTG